MKTDKMLRTLQRLKFGQAVRVMWDDSAIEPGWKPPLAAGLGKVVTLGYVVAYDKDKLSLSHSIDRDAGVLAPLTIPVGVIRQVDLLPKEWAR